MLMNAPSVSRYHEVYGRWKADPAAFWAEAAREIDWFKPAERVFDPAAGVYGRWFAGGVCNTCYNAVDRHVAAGRGEQAAIIYDSPVTRHEAHAHLSRSCWTRWRALAAVLAGPRRRDGRPRHHLHADDPGSGDRHARLRPHRRHPFRGVRRLRGERAGDPHRRRRAEADPVGVVRRRGARVIAYKPLLDEAIELSRRQAGCLPDLAAPAAPRRNSLPAATSTGHERVRAARTAASPPLRAGRGDRSALHPLHVRHDRPAQGRGARQRRPPGRAEMVDENLYGVGAGRSVLDGVGRRLGRRSFLHRLRPAAARLHDHPLRGQAGRHARRRRLLARRRRARRRDACSPRRPPSAPSRRKIPRHASRSATTCEVPRPVPRRRARRSRHGAMGANAVLARAGHRSLVADRDRLGDRRQSARPRACCR